MFAWLLLPAVVSAVLSAASPPEVIIVVACTAHYTDFFENWYAWMERLDLSAGLITIAEDSQAYDYLRRRFVGEAAYRRVVRASEGGEDPPLGGTLGFESSSFAHLMSRRAAHIESQLYELASTSWATPGARLIFSDLDVVWIRDPRPWFVGACDAWAQTQHRERRLLNPGFLALTPSPRALTLLREWARRLQQHAQLNLPVFNDVVRALADKVKVCALQPDVFLSAKRSFRRRTWSPTSDERAVIAHANWIDGHDAKRAAFQAAGAWLVSSNLSAALIPN